MSGIVRNTLLCCTSTTCTTIKPGNRKRWGTSVPDELAINKLISRALRLCGEAHSNRTVDEFLLLGVWQAPCVLAASIIKPVLVISSLAPRKLFEVFHSYVTNQGSAPEYPCYQREVLPPTHPRISVPRPSPCARSNTQKNIYTKMHRASYFSQIYKRKPDKFAGQHVVLTLFQILIPSLQPRQSTYSHLLSPYQGAPIPIKLFVAELLVPICTKRFRHNDWFIHGYEFRVRVVW